MMENIIIGKNVEIQKNVVIGEKGIDTKKGAELYIGDDSKIRSFTVIYLDNKIGKNFQTGHHSVIREKNVIGDNCVVGTGTSLECGNKIGNNVRIHSGCMLEKTIVGDDVFIGPNSVFLNNIHPVCPKIKECVGGPKIGSRSVIGANSTILPGVKIGKNCFIGAGSVVTKDIPHNMVAYGSPAKVVKKIDELKCIKGFYKKPYEWREKK